MNYQARGDLVACHRHRDWSVEDDEVYIILAYQEGEVTPWVVALSYRSGRPNWSSGEYFSTYEAAMEVYQDTVRRFGWHHDQ